jgi:regulatory protein
MSTAMRLLARREHAERELRTKLVARGFALSEIERCLAELKQRGWQSDARYAELLVKSRSARGQGPNRIARSLQQQGLSADPIRDSDIDWEARALEVLAKFLRGKDPSAFEVRMKAMRHLQLKGFSSAQGRTALARFQQQDRE